MNKKIIRSLLLVSLCFTMILSVLEQGISAYAAPVLSEEERPHFSEKTQKLLDMLNEAYPEYFCYVPEEKRDQSISSLEMSDEDLYTLLMSLNVTQELLISQSTESELLLIEDKDVPNEPKSSVYGAAVPYYNNTSTSVNCYGYIMLQPLFVNPGYMTGAYYSGAAVNIIAYNVISDYNARSLGARTIGGGLAGVSSNEYRVATRTGNHYISGVLVYDYHFMRQTNIGEWAEKRGAGPSVNRGAIDPATASWNLYDVSNNLVMSNFYDSTTYFLAVRLY